MMIGAAVSPFRTSTQMESSPDSSDDSIVVEQDLSAIPFGTPGVTPVPSPKSSPVGIAEPTPVTPSPSLTPKSLFAATSADDAKFRGEVSGLEIINKDPVSDTTASNEADKEDPPCKGDNCKASINDNMLKCKECKNSFHYECTKLPAYFLHILVSKKRTFSCWHCYPVPDNLMEQYSSSDSQSALSFHHLKNLEKSLMDGLSSKFAAFERSTVAAMSADKWDALSATIKAREEEIKALKVAKSQNERDLSEARKQIVTLEKNLAELEEKRQPPTVSSHSDLSRSPDESEFLALTDQLKLIKAEYASLKLVHEEDIVKARKEKLEAEMACNQIVDELRLRCDAKLSEYADTEEKLMSLEEELNSYKLKCDLLSSDLLKQKLHNEASNNPDSFTTATASGKHTGDKSNTNPRVGHTGEKPSEKSSVHTGEKPSRGTYNNPNVLSVGNSLSKGFDPKKLFAPLYTRVHTLGAGDKNLDGALKFIEKTDIVPDNVVLHILENDIVNDSKETLRNKLELVKKKCRSKFSNANIFVVEPIGRGSDEYMDKVGDVRKDLELVFSADRIIRTEALHEVSDALFQEDKIHLKHKGTAALCVAYKRAVLPALGVSYVEPQLRDDTTQPDRRETSIREYRSTHRRNANPRGPKRHSSSSMEAQFMEHMRAFFMK